MQKLWTREACEQAVNILRKSSTHEEALKKISRLFHRPITRFSLIHGLEKNGFETPGKYLHNKETPLPSLETAPSPKDTMIETNPDIKKLVQLIRKKSFTLQSLCDVFGYSPKKMSDLVEKAEKSGYMLGIVNKQVTFKQPNTVFAETYVEPYPKFKAGDELSIMVVSDIHAGSRYHLGEHLREFLEKGYKKGIRHIFCPGDNVEGRYKHARWELLHHSWDEQADALLEVIPNYPDLHFHFIDGNHDYKWTEETGYESGRALVNHAKSKGRNNLHFYGSRGALIDFGGTRIELWHPCKGMGYARSYPLQNKIRDTNPRFMPDILLAGHWHQYTKVRQQATWAFACGTFQHGIAPFSLSIGGDSAKGGNIITWRKDSDGVVRELGDKFSIIEYDPPIYMVKP